MKADWSRPFDDPIPLPDGRELVTLRQAGEYITSLPKAEHDKPHWLFAVEMLLLAAQGQRPVMMADIAMRRALNHGRPKPPPAPRKKRVKKYRVVR